MRNIFKRKNLLYKSYGIVGASKGCGVTHLSLSIANYLASVLGVRVTYIELAKESKLLHVVDEKKKKVESKISYRRVDYVIAASEKEALEELRNSRSIIIVDFDVLDNSTKQVFLECERVIVIGSFSPWKQREYLEFVKQNYNLMSTNKSTVFCGVGIKKQEKRTFNKIFNFEIRELDLVKNPFQIREDELNVIERIIG